jgi:signal peptidase II
VADTGTLPPFAAARGGSHRALGYGIAVLWLVLDQLSKWAVIHPLALPDRASVEILPIFRLIWVQNFGISLGKFQAGTDTGRWLLVAVTAAIAIGVAVWLWRERNGKEAAALGLVLGGALGNIGDRVRLGYVADFLNLHFGAWSPFLVFNVADVGVSVGVAVLVLRALFQREPGRLEK